MHDKTIDFIDFEKIDIRLGTIIEAVEYDELRVPSILLKIDFGKKEVFSPFAEACCALGKWLGSLGGEPGRTAKFNFVLSY